MKDLELPEKNPTSIRPVREKNMYFSTLMGVRETPVSTLKHRLAEISHPRQTCYHHVGLRLWLGEVAHTLPQGSNFWNSDCHNTETQI